MSSFLTAPELPRIPLVPQSLLKAHDVDCTFDSRFCSAARLLARLWLQDNKIATGVHVRPSDDGDIVTPFGSLLSPAAAQAGRNFLTPEIHTFVRRELIMREEGAYYEVERLFGNALSSAPLTMNIFVPLAMNLELATSVFRLLLPTFVQDVKGIRFETSPLRRETAFVNDGLEDGTAFDLALDILTWDGEQGTVYVEIKFSESMEGPPARHRERYDIASRKVGLFVDPDAAILRSLALEQLWREAMLAQLSIDAGITPRAMFIAIGPRLNRRVQAAFRVFANELISDEHLEEDRVRFQAITLETVVDAIRQVGAVELATMLWARYCDFERVFHLCMAEYANEHAELSHSAEPARSEAKPRNRRRPSEAVHAG